MSDGTKAPRPTLETRLEQIDRLIGELREAKKALKSAAKRKKKRPPYKPEAPDQGYLVEMAEMIIIPPAFKPRGQAAKLPVFQREIGWAAKQIEVKTPRYKKGTNIAKTLRKKFENILRLDDYHKLEEKINKGEIDARQIWLELATRVTVLQRIIVREKYRLGLVFGESPEWPAQIGDLDQLDHMLRDLGADLLRIGERWWTEGN
jgi:hypothetical protein